jgi:4-hydroxybenzoate polyprenyltransferase
MGNKSLLHRFNIYQQERFPLAVLIFTTLAVVLSSYAILYSKISLHTYAILIATFSGLSYVFHIRVMDEKRDYQDDKIFFKNRPIFRGIITLRELFWLDIIGLIVSLILTAFISIKALILFVFGLVFIYIASEDFFIRKHIIKKMIIYHFLNSIQMIILQFSIYFFFVSRLKFNKIIFAHVIFVQFCIFLVEVVRKSGTTKNKEYAIDSYFSKYGKKKLFFILLIIDIIIFLSFFLLSKFMYQDILIFICGFFFFLLFICMIIIYYLCADNVNYRSIKLYSILYYIIMNLLIFVGTI